MTPGFQGIVTDRYKYVEYDDGSTQLIDLKHDPHESSANLVVGRHAAVVAPADARRPPARHDAGRAPRPRSRPDPAPRWTAGRGFHVLLAVPVRDLSLPAGARRHARPPGSPVPASSTRWATSRTVTTCSRWRGSRRPRRPHPCVASVHRVDARRPGRHADLAPRALAGRIERELRLRQLHAERQFQCRLIPWGAEAPWSPCDPAGVSFDGLADGSYRFEVVARDPVTGASSDPAAGWFFRMDTRGTGGGVLDGSTGRHAADGCHLPLRAARGHDGRVRDARSTGKPVGCAKGSSAARARRDGATHAGGLGHGPAGQRRRHVLSRGSSTDRRPRCSSSLDRTRTTDQTDGRLRPLVQRQPRDVRLSAGRSPAHAVLHGARCSPVSRTASTSWSCGPTTRR